MTELLHLWARVSLIQDTEYKRKGLIKIQKYIQKKTHVLHLPKFQLSIPYTLGTSHLRISKIAKNITQTILESSISHLLKQQIRIIARNRLSIAAYLTNNRKIKFHKDIPPKCLGYPYCGDNHYSKRLHDKEGEAKKLMSMQTVSQYPMAQGIQQSSILL